jgi:hypothetical protein
MDGNIKQIVLVALAFVVAVYIYGMIGAEA